MILMMPTKMKRIVKFFAPILLFSLGWVVGLLVKDLNWFQYDSSFNLFELLYCLIAAGVALYLGGVIERGLQDRRNQKDILIKKYVELDEALKSVQSSIKYNAGVYEVSDFEINRTIQRVGILSEQAEKVLKRLYPQALSDTDYSKVRSRPLSKKCTQLRKGNVDISRNGDTWLYSPNRFVEIEKEIWSCREKCFNNMLVVNKQ